MSTETQPKCPCGVERSADDTPVRAYGFFGGSTSVGIMACVACGLVYVPIKQLRDQQRREAPPEETG